MAENQPLRRLREALKKHGSRNVGDNWTCPAHDDEHPSLTIRAGEMHPVVLFCHAGCKPDDVLTALGTSWRDVLDGDPKRIVATESYTYHDEEKEPLYRVQRLTMADGSKTFRQQRALTQGRWAKDLGDARLVLWNLPQLRKRVKQGWRIHLTEGEKDARALNAYFKEHELPEYATCHPGGAGKWSIQGRDVGYLESLRWAEEVVVWGDRDAAGYRDALDRLTSVSGVHLVVLARLPKPKHPKADVFDHLAAGFAPDDGVEVDDNELRDWLGESEEDKAVLQAIRELILAAEDSASDHLAYAFTDDDVLAKDDPQYVIESWVPRGLYTMLFGPPGVGKTFALLGMSRAVRRGTRWQAHPTIKGATLFYQGEGLSQLKPRIKAWDARYDEKPMQPGFFFDHFVDLTRPEGVAAVARTVRRLERREHCTISMVIIDPLVEFMTGDENREGMDRATKGIRALATYLDIAVVVGHHTNAAGERARGADFHRMRAGAFIEMEELPDGLIGLFQHKQKSGERFGMILRREPSEDSLVLEWDDPQMPVADYMEFKKSAEMNGKAKTKSDSDDRQFRRAGELLEKTIENEPGIATDRLLKACVGQDVGKTRLEKALATLIEMGRVRVEKGPRNARLHYLATDE